MLVVHFSQCNGLVPTKMKLLGFFFQSKGFSLNTAQQFIDSIAVHIENVLELI